MKRLILRKIEGPAPMFKASRTATKYRYEIIEPETGKLLLVKNSNEDIVAMFVRYNADSSTRPNMILYTFGTFLAMGKGYSSNWKEQGVNAVALIEITQDTTGTYPIIRKKDQDVCGPEVLPGDIPEDFWPDDNYPAIDPGDLLLDPATFANIQYLILKAKAKLQDHPTRPGSNNRAFNEGFKWGFKYRSLRMQRQQADESVAVVADDPDPIHVRPHEGIDKFVAFRDSYDGAPGGKGYLGYGQTEEEARADLIFLETENAGGEK